MHVETPDFDQVSVVSAVTGNELSNHLEGLGGVDLIVLVGAVEGLVTHAVRVEVATVFVTNSILALSLVVVAAINTFAAIVAWFVARVGSELSGETVGLPNVHFCAASTIVAAARVAIFGGRSPVLAVGLAIDPLHIMRALCVAISSSILGPSLVIRVRGFSPIGFHLDEVEGSVDTTLKFGDVDVE